MPDPADTTHQPVQQPDADVAGAPPLDPATAADEVARRAGFHVRMFGSPRFFRLWLAQFVSAMGDWLGFLAINVLAVRIATGSPEAAIGFVMSARIVPGIFLGSLGAAVVDRWDRKRVMVVCDVGRAAVLATLPFVDTVYGLVFASLLLEMFTLVWSPAKEASVPNLVPQDYLTTANSLSMAAAYGTFPLASLLFAALAGLAKWLGGFDALDVLRINQEALAFYFDVLTFLASAMLIWTLDLPARPKVRRDGGRDVRSGFHDSLEELREGWRYIFVNPTVRAINVGLATGLIGAGMLVPLGPIFVKEVLGGGASAFGLFVTTLGLGVASGVVGVSVVLKRLPKTTVFTGSVLAAGVFLFCAASVSSLTPGLMLIGLMGACGGSIYVLGFTILQEAADDEYRGRSFSALYTLSRVCLLVAFVVGPFLSKLLDYLSERFFDGRVELAGVEVGLPGVRLAIWLAAVIIVAAGLVSAHSVSLAESLENDDTRSRHPSGDGPVGDDGSPIFEQLAWGVRMVAEERAEEMLDDFAAPDTSRSARNAAGVRWRKDTGNASEVDAAPPSESDDSS